MREPQDCRTMAELRAGIDALDRQLVGLLVRRAEYIDRAAVLKPAEGLPARIETRIDEVRAHVRAQAVAARLDPDLADRLWRELIEWSIRREEDVMGRTEDRA